MDAVFEAASNTIYQRNGTIVRVKDNSIDEVDAEQLQSHLIDNLTPITIKISKEGDEIQMPAKKFEKDLCQHMINRTEIGLKSLKYVYRCPVFAGDWKPLGEHGYHENMQAWLNTDSIEADLMPLKKATELIDDLLIDFPFSDVASKTHAVMALLTPFIRPMVGMIPLFLITAPTEGSGKTMLAEICGLISDGYEQIKITAPSDDDEWRKKITSTLRDAPSVVIIDNIVDLDSPSLASALTSQVWTDRKLGGSSNVSYPNDSVWFASGNNPTISPEMARRCVLIHIVPDTERPGEREFKYPDIKGHVISNRDKYVSALMSIIHHWTLARSTTDVLMGSYQQWATAAASIAAHAGYVEALTNRDIMRTEQSDDLAILVEAWAAESYKRKNATSGDLENICSEADILGHIRGGSHHKSQRARKLSVYLGGQADRVCGSWRIVVAQDTHSKQKVYSLESVQ
jgi:hypothetical protein